MRLGMGAESVNRAIFMLLGSGLLSEISIITASEGPYYVTLKGRALLRLLGIIKSEVWNGFMRPELIYVLNYLKIEPPKLTNISSLMSLDASSLNHSNIDNLIEFLYDDIIEWSEQEIGSFLLNSTVANANKWPNQVAFIRLAWMVRDLEKAWDIDLRDQTFETPSWETDPRYPWEKDSTYFTVLEYPFVNKIYLKRHYFSLKRAFRKAGLDHLNVIIAGKDGGEAVYIREAAIKIEPVYLVKNDQMNKVKMPAWNIDIPFKTKDPNRPDFTVVDVKTYKTMDSAEMVVEEVLLLIAREKNLGTLVPFSG